MYYKLVAGEDVFESNPGLKAVPGFNGLTDTQMKFVCLMCDPSQDNPIRTLQGRQKREKAALLAGYRMEPDGKRLDRNARDVADGKVRSIEEGINLFKSLHYDENIDTHESMVFQINEIRDYLKSKKNNSPVKMKQAIYLGAKLPELVEARQKIEKLLNINTTIKPELGATFTAVDVTEDPDKPESSSMSLLDRFHSNTRN